MPFEDLTGNSGFTSDSEGAEATLNFNISDDSARTLWDVQAAVQQIAVDFQTAVRAASDFNSYLISMRETAQTLKMPSMNLEGGEGGNMSYAGGRVDSGSVPLIQSEVSQVQRIGEMEENATGAGGGMMAAAGAARALGGRTMDPGSLVGNLTQAAFLASATGQQEHIPHATGNAYQQAYQFAQNMSPLDPRLRGARYQGQRGTPHAFAASQIISQGLPAAQQFLGGGGVGGFAAMLGRLGAAGAIGYSVYQLADAGLETYAQSRALGIATNNSDHGAAWGFGTRIGQASMAMSPFVSSEEAAQIYNTAVNQGWASKRGGFAEGDFSSAVNFMYGAAKDYNMDPAMSGQLLHSNAMGAGQSIQALSEQLLTLKQTLDGTGVSMDAASSTFTSFTGMLIASGATAPMASQIAGGALSAYSGNAYLGPSGRGAEIVQQTMGTQQTQNILAALTGTLPGAALASGGHLQASTAELDKLTKRFTDQVMSMNNLDPPEKAAMFAQIYNATFGTQITPQEASNMMAVNIDNPNALTEGQKKYLEKGKIGKLDTRSWGASAWNDIDNLLVGMVADHSSTLEGQETNSAAINIYSHYNEEVNTLLENSGDNLQNVVLYGPDGKPVQSGGNRVAGANIAKWFNDPANYAKFADPNSGYYIQDQNDNKYNSKNIGLGGSNAINPNDTGSNDKNTIYIKLASDAKRLIDTDKTQLNLDTGHN